jgi:ribosomal protein S1
VSHLIPASPPETGYFGSIVELRPGVGGLLLTRDAGTNLSVGDSVDVVVVEVDSNSKRIYLKRSPRS